MTNQQNNFQNSPEPEDLFAAARSGDAAAAERLLAGGADPRETDEHLLWPINYSASPEMAECLLRGGTSLSQRNARGACVLHMAVEINHLQLLEWLAALGADLEVRDACDETPLTWATAYGRLECLRKLLALGAQTNPRGLERTPLHWAVKENQLDAAELLLARGAELNARARRIGAPLHVAAEHGTPEMVRLLARYADKADLNIGHRARNGHSPLHRAAAARNPAAARALLAAGARADAQDRNCWTPLHWAVKNWCFEVAEVLMEYGADPGARSRRGATPLDLAREKEMLSLDGQIYISARAARREPLRDQFIELLHNGLRRRPN